MSERGRRERDLPLPPSASPRRHRRPPNSPWIPRAEVNASTGHFPSPPLPSFSAAAAGSIRAIGGFRPPGAAAVARRGVGFPSRAPPPPLEARGRRGGGWVSRDGAVEASVAANPGF